MDEVEPLQPEQPEDGRGAVKTVVDEIAAYLGLVFRPAAGQLGLIVSDQVQHWRLRNLERLADKVKRGRTRGRANPRVAWSVLEQATSTDDDGLLDMWAGLLDSSRSESDPADTNIMFTSRLAQMSAVQAEILNHLCTEWKKRENKDLMVGHPTTVTIVDDPFFSKFDRVALDLDLDHLRHLGLIEGGIDMDDPESVRVAASALGLHMYVRCVGSQLAPVDYFLTDPNVLRAGSDATSGQEPPAIPE
jgi:hypothetical protein